MYYNVLHKVGYLDSLHRRLARSRSLTMAHTTSRQYAAHALRLEQRITIPLGHAHNPLSINSLWDTQHLLGVLLGAFQAGVPFAKPRKRTDPPRSIGAVGTSYLVLGA